jgi:hypothetical protein
VTLSCLATVAFLHSGCNAVARKYAVPQLGVEAEDVIEETHHKLVRRLQRRCGDPTACPAIGGPGQPACLIVAEGNGEAFVRVAVANMAKSMVTARLRRPHVLVGDLVSEEDDPDKVELFIDRTDPADEVENKRYRERLRQAAKQDPAVVWPGVSPLRIEAKVEAVEALLDGRARDIGEALRLVDPGYYAGANRKRVERDGEQVRLICRYLMD